MYAPNTDPSVIPEPEDSYSRAQFARCPACFNGLVPRHERRPADPACLFCQGTGKVKFGFEIPSHKLPELARRAKMLRRRGQRAGMTQVEFGYEELGEIVERLHDEVTDLPGGRVRRLTVIRFFGSAPVVAGYEFVAALEHHEAGNLINKAPTYHDVELDQTWRTAPPHCDHCHTTRRRNQTFILREVATDKILQVGTNCLADFLRSDDVAAALKWWSLYEYAQGLADGSDEDERGGGGHYEIATEHYLATACASVRTLGFRGAKHEGYKTRDDIAFLMGRPPEDREAAQDWKNRQPTEADFARAQLILAWVAARPAMSEYDHNLRVALLTPVITGRSEGIVASAPQAYAREIERELNQRQTRAQAQAAGHFGEVGKRYPLTLTLTKRVSFETQFGYQDILLFQDAQGHVFKWKTGSFGSGSAGDVFQGKCTVKKHDEYNGTPQTVLTRCSIDKCDQASDLQGSES